MILVVFKPASPLSIYGNESAHDFGNCCNGSVVCPVNKMYDRWIRE